MNVTSPWEPVHTVNDFFDVPRIGVADFGGVPHVYSCVFDQDEDEWSSKYRVAPIGPEGLAVVLEAWAIWSRWLAAYHGGTLTETDHHPALAVDRSRHEELEPIVATYLLVAGGFLAEPKFRGSMYPYAMEVCWVESGSNR
jgi:hypothetical protein